MCICGHIEVSQHTLRGNRAVVGLRHLQTKCRVSFGVVYLPQPSLRVYTCWFRHTQTLNVRLSLCCDGVIQIERVLNVLCSFVAVHVLVCPVSWWLCLPTTLHVSNYTHTLTYTCYTHSSTAIAHDLFKMHFICWKHLYLFTETTCWGDLEVFIHVSFAV